MLLKQNFKAILYNRYVASRNRAFYLNECPHNKPVRLQNKHLCFYGYSV